MRRPVRRLLSLAVVVGCAVAAALFAVRGVDRRAEAAEAARAASLAASLGYPTPLARRAADAARPRWPVILMPAHGRPGYLARVLEALARVRHVNETLVVVSQDGRDADVHALLAAAASASSASMSAAASAAAASPLKLVHLRHRPPYLGLPSLVVSSEYATSANVHFLLATAFDSLGAPAAIVLESDLVPAPDLLEYFGWAADHFLLPEDGPWADRVLCVNGFNEGSHAHADPYELRPARFVVWGWATAARLWPLFRDGWTWFDNWDWTVQRNVREANRRFCVSPALSRIRNIGMQGINFNVPPQEEYKWNTYLRTDPVDYGPEHPPHLVDFVDPVICPLVSGNPSATSC